MLGQGIEMNWARKRLCSRVKLQSRFSYAEFYRRYVIIQKIFEFKNSEESQDVAYF